MKKFLNDEILRSLGALALIALIFFLIAQGFATLAGLKIQTKTAHQNNLTFRGTAEIKTVPDIALFNFTIREVDLDVSLAQQKMAEKTNKLFALLEESGVRKSDIQTANYSSYPKYNYLTQPCVNGVCPAGKQVLEGYEATQTVTVKLRDNAKNGEILSKAAALQINEVFGPNFTVEDPQKFKMQAQLEAIKKAKEEAQLTAENLGIKLGKIIRFQEEPLYNLSSRPMMKAAAMADSSSEVTSSQIAAGEEKISMSVSITYEIE